MRVKTNYKCVCDCDSIWNISTAAAAMCALFPTFKDLEAHVRTGIS
jgi:hypothetical protein